MTPNRFDMPGVGPSLAVRFPPVAREVLGNGLGVWSSAQSAHPVVSATVVILAGSADDPADRPGLISLLGDLLDEGAGGRDAIGLSDALARLGSRLTVDVGPDAMAISIASLARHFEETLAIVADIVRRPHLADADFERVRDLTRNRLRQLRQSPGTVADRAFTADVYEAHPYGHGGLGTTRALDALTLDELRSAWARVIAPSRSTLVVAGDVTPDAVMRAATALFGSWTGNDLGGRFADFDNSGSRFLDLNRNDPRGRFPVLLIDRPGAPQSELRIGHRGPPRTGPDYHALITLNAVLGGQFSSRLNRNLRETRGITYGVRTAFDMRRAGGSFGCETSVQVDATAVAVGEILSEFRAIQAPDAVGADELALSTASLTRGYVRHFETAAHLARGLVELATYGLAADTFDWFVPAVEAMTPSDVARVSQATLRPDACTVVVVGDAALCRGPLEALGRPVTSCEPEF